MPIARQRRARRQPLLINAVVVAVLVIAKLSQLHGVRIFGINKD